MTGGTLSRVLLFSILQPRVVDEGGGDDDDRLLQQNGDAILQQNGDYILISTE